MTVNIRNTLVNTIKIADIVYSRGMKARSIIYHRRKERRWCKTHQSTLSKDQIAQVKSYWKQYTNNFTIDSHRKYSAITGNFNVRYIPDDLFYGVIEPYLNKRDSIFGNKSYYPLIFPECKTPDVVFHKMNGYYLDRDYHFISEDQALELCTEYNEVFFKPSIDSGGGRKIAIVKSRDIRALRDEIANRRLNEIPSLVVQQLVKQHPALSAIHKGSVNTIGITTLLRDSIITLPPVLRMGVHNNHVDNVGAGGIVCGIQANNRLMPYAFSQNGERLETHPDGFVFNNCLIPSMDKARILVKQLAQRLPDFRLIGWDIAIGADGEPIVIEANLNSGGSFIFQCCHGPFFGDLTDAMLKEIFRDKKQNLMN
jgi:hypothetical protein